MTVREDFFIAVHQAISECYKIGYTPHRFEEMLNSAHPVEVAKSLVVSGAFQYGIKHLAKLNRLDLSIEHIMSEPKFASLFTKDEIAAAQWRLSHVPK